MSATRRYLAEIHDLHPGMGRRLDALLEALPPDARQTAVLLVVPNWREREPLHQHRDFVRRLRALPGEKVLHGYTHSLGPSLWNHLYFGTENHSEFLHATRRAAEHRIAQACRIYEQCFDRRPRWFCGPRWQQSRATERALRLAGLAGYMRQDRIVEFAGQAHDIPAICFDEGARRWKQAAARALRERAIRKLVQRGALFRLTLHPSDVDYPRTWKQLTDLIFSLQHDGWKPVSLEEALQS